MTRTEFDKIQIGDICKVIRGKDSGTFVRILYKDCQPGKFGQRDICVLLAKPLHILFDSPTVSYRYFKLFSHTELAFVGKD